MSFTNEKKEIRLPSVVVSSTIFFSGAEVLRSANTSLPKGENQLLFEHLPHNLVVESIQVFCSEPVTLFSVEHQIDHLQEELNGQEYEKLLLKKGDLEKEKKILLSKINVIVLEEEMLLLNSALAGSETGLDVENLKESILFVNERRSSISIQKIDLEIALDKLQEELTEITNQLNLYKTRSKIGSTITVKVISEKMLENVTFKISYFIHDAGWTPIYDIRAVDTASNINLHYKAKVFQRTAEDWEGVSLTLSTSNPTRNNNCPELTPWYIDFNQPSVVIDAFQNAPRMEVSSSPMEELSIKELEKERGINPTSIPVQENQNMTGIDYKIQVPCTIPMKGTPQMIEVVKYELSADYQYVCVRKLDKEVFLIAEVQGWEQLGLIAGETSIFFENKYVGKSFLDPRKADEKLKLSLGTDKNIIVTRVNGKNFSGKRLIGSATEQTREWTVTVRNLKNMKIHLTLFDQIPVSSNKQIIVEAVELSDGILDKETGKITWETEIAPSESKSFFVKYSVKSPKSETVLLD